MRIAFRTDASSEIGTGHLMRCLTLAVEMKRNKAQVCFICRNLPDYLSEMLTLNGIELKSLIRTQDDTELDELAHASWLGVSQTNDALESIHLLSGAQWDWIVIDHYALDFRWESKVRPSVEKLLVIDDIADRKHDCDILLDQNYYADMEERYKNLVPGHCQLLLGSRYALLRSEFQKLHEKIKPHNGLVKRILIFFGGIDNDNYTGLTIVALSKIDLSGLCIDVVIGAQNPNREKIALSCVQHGYICHIQTDKMAELMAAADFAIGAGGSATWERCCLALPSLTLSLAYNQVGIAKGLNSLGAGQYFDSQSFESENSLHKTIHDLIQDESKLEKMSKKAYSIVDGKGVNRLYKRLTQ